MYSPLSALSPLDGRYNNSVKELGTYFSEAALMRYRIYVEVEYLIALSHEKKIEDLVSLTKNQQNKLRKLYQNFDFINAQEVKNIESDTNHDVKAIEYYIQNNCSKNLHPWIHFALTSEDINNISYSLMWKHAIKQVYMPSLGELYSSLKKLSKQYSKTPMLSMTHGQPATPTTFGKELAVFCNRISRQLYQLKRHRLQGKLSGATGNWAAHISAYPNVNWQRFTKRFLKSIGLEANLITTQIEPHDSAIESYHQIIRLNSILKDLCIDIWLYISRGILQQKKIRGEVGSSTMPHKINPIQFENAEGNLGISNALLSYFADKLPISRMQRDLSDSTVLRNQGIALGYSYLALKNISKGFSRIAINKKRMKTELNNHWEVLAEALQTILRRAGKKDAYENLKELTRGEKINKDSLETFIKSLKISANDKEFLLKLSPELYTGNSSDIAGSL